MNQFNVNIDEVLKESLEDEKPSVSFEDVWDKYNKKKGPSIVLKRVTVLVAAAFVLVVATKYISSMTGTNNDVASRKTLLSASMPKEAMANKKENKAGKEVNNEALLYTKTPSSVEKANDSAKAKVFISKAINNTVKSKVIPQKEKEKNIVAAVAGNKNTAASLKKSDNNSNTRVFVASDISSADQNPATLQAQGPMTMKRATTDSINVAAPGFVIWENRSYYITSDAVDENSLGEIIGRTVKETEEPKGSLEGRGIPVDTTLYKILDSDPGNVIAIKLGDIYYRAVVK